MVGKLANSAMCFDNDAYESQHCFSLGCMYMYYSSEDLLVQCKSAVFALKVFFRILPSKLKLFNNTMQLNFAPDCIHCLCFFWQWYSRLNDIIFYIFFFFAKYFKQLSNNMSMQCVYTFEKIYNKYNCIWKIRNFAFVSLANLLFVLLLHIILLSVLWMEGWNARKTDHNEHLKNEFSTSPWLNQRFHIEQLLNINFTIWRTNKTKPHLF